MEKILSILMLLNGSGPELNDRAINTSAYIDVR